MNSATFTFDLFLQKNGCQKLYKKGGGDINEGHIPPRTVGENREFWLLKTSLIFQVISWDLDVDLLKHITLKIQ